MAWGGKRPRAGRRKKAAALRMLDGGASHSREARAAARQTAEVVPTETFPPGDYLTSDERAVWDRLAPHAFQTRTLTRATELDFERLCRHVVLEQALHADDAERGGSSHRGIIQRVDAGLARFNLAPCGKPIYETQPVEEKPANPLERFLKKA